MGYNPSMKDLTGKTILITGGTTGIGKEAARRLVQLGAHVLVTARDEAKGLAAVSEINKDAHGTAAAELMLVDLSSFSAVRAFADEVIARCPKLHALVNNAGVMEHEAKTSADGIELDTAVDFYAPVLLAELLLPLIQTSAPAAIINVSSSMHHEGNIDFSTFGKVEFFHHYRSYADAKLALILYTRLLARRLKGVKEGAAGIALLLADDKMSRITGEYVVGEKIDIPSERVEDDAKGEELYQRTREILGLP
jgi:NAD(P)-dependent dehydrogenase (short-subunit alcohol dehydrogenase family)